MNVPYHDIEKYIAADCETFDVHATVAEGSHRIVHLMKRVNRNPFCGAAPGTVMIARVSISEKGIRIGFAYRSDKWNDVASKEFLERTESSGWPYPHIDFDDLFTDDPSLAEQP